MGCKKRALRELWFPVAACFVLSSLIREVYWGAIFADIEQEGLKMQKRPMIPDKIIRPQTLFSCKRHHKVSKKRKRTTWWLGTFCQTMGHNERALSSNNKLNNDFHSKMEQFLKGWILTLQGLAVIIQVSIHAIENRVHSVGGVPWIN